MNSRRVQPVSQNLLWDVKIFSTWDGSQVYGITRLAQGSPRNFLEIFSHHFLGHHARTRARGALISMYNDFLYSR